MIFDIYSRCTPLLLGTQVSDIGPSWSSCLPPCTVSEAPQNLQGVVDHSRLSLNNLPTVPYPFTARLSCILMGYYCLTYTYICSLSVSSSLLSSLSSSSDISVSKRSSKLLLFFFKTLFTADDRLTPFSLSILICWTMFLCTELSLRGTNRLPVRLYIARRNSFPKPVLHALWPCQQHHPHFRRPTDICRTTCHIYL